MSVAEKLERLARWVPGIAGYQDRESARETDKTLRLQLAGVLAEARLGVEEVKRALVDAKRLDGLAALDRLSSKLDKCENLTRYAGRGYRGWFDQYKVTRATLEQLYAYDLSLVEYVERVRRQVQALQRGGRGADELTSAIDAVERALDHFAQQLDRRSDLMTQRTTG
ncbi:MAG: hypothetical protein ACOYXU_07560 [Nitrospirota bacterium]